MDFLTIEESLGLPSWGNCRDCKQNFTLISPGDMVEVRCLPCQAKWRINEAASKHQIGCTTQEDSDLLGKD